MFRNKTPILTKIVSIGVALFALGIPILLNSSVLALSCSVDPDYSQYGNVPSQDTGATTCPPSQYAFQAGSNPTDPNMYIVIGDPANPVATLTPQLSSDPLVWKGTANYDGHSIVINIPKADIQQATSDVTADRLDSVGGAIPVQTSISIPVNDLLVNFANKLGITLSYHPENSNVVPGAKYGCGSKGGNKGPEQTTSIDFGCKGNACINNSSTDAYCAQPHNGIIDLLFAIIRFLSIGVGIIVIGSLVVAGIQFTASSGDPQATGRAIARIRSTILALLLYIFAYAILNYVIPVGFLKQ